MFIIILAALLAVVMIMIAGVRWMTAMGNQGQLDSAKTMIINSIIGLVLALGSFFILHSINPALTTNEPIKIAMIRTKALKAKNNLELKLCKQYVGVSGNDCGTFISDKNNCAATTCMNTTFVCQIRSEENLSGDDGITNIFKENSRYSKIFGKYFKCNDSIVVPLMPGQECSTTLGISNEIEWQGKKLCWYSIDSGVECGKYKAVLGKDHIGKKCPINKNVCFFQKTDGQKTQA